jgi:hypothetical protein
VDTDDSIESRTRRLENAERKVSDLNDQILRDWRVPADKPIQTACDDARLVAKFVDQYLESDIDRAMRAPLERDKDFVDAFELIEMAVDELRGVLLAMGNTGPAKPLVDQLVNESVNLRQALEEAVRAFVAVVHEQAEHGLSYDVRKKALWLASETRSQLRSQQYSYEAAQAAVQAEQARDETQRARDKAREAAGSVGADRLGAGYSDYADKETRIADRLRWGAAGLVVTVALCATGFAIWFDEVSIGNELLRLSVTIPLAVLAGYLARESTKHRTAARPARDLAIALHTMPSYTEPLDDVGRELRRELGMRAFGSSGDRPAVQDNEGLYADLTALLQRVDDTVRRIREAADGPK